jgi:hypothetical protein
MTFHSVSLHLHLEHEGHTIGATEENKTKGETNILTQSNLLTIRILLEDCFSLTDCRK